ncbi:MAG: AAA family ATPase [Desulfarculus sp.]|nr:AAA family ATPase [Desulfarculus sp.]
MYTDFYGLKEKPFAAEPSPRFLVLMEEHQEALATLVYAIDQQEGWALVVGEPGVGKTTLIIALLREMGDRVLSAVVTNPKLVPLDFFNQLALELGLDGPFASKGPFLAALAQLLGRCRREGKLILVVVDEAQDLSAEMLEELRLLGNLDNSSPKVLNIFLVGQPEIVRVLKRSAARALLQRLHRSYALKPLNAEATALYVRQRLKLAGAQRDIFDPEALAVIHQVSRGVPRLINSVCDDAMLQGLHEGQHQLGADIVLRAAAEDPSLDWPPAEDTSPASPACPPPLEEPAWPPQPAPAAPSVPARPPATPAAPVSGASRTAALAAELAGEPPQAAQPEPAPRPQPPREARPPRRPQDEPRRPARPEPRQEPPDEYDLTSARSVAPRRGLLSRFAASLSREAPGSLFKRILVLVVLLSLLLGGYAAAKKLWPKVRHRLAGPSIEIPDALPEVAKAAPKAKEGPLDWGPTLKAANIAITPKEGRHGQND